MLSQGSSVSIFWVDSDFFHVSLLAEELVCDSRVHILLLGLHSVEDVALDNRNLLPVVQDLHVVHLDLAFELLDSRLVLFFLAEGIRSVHPCRRRTSTLSAIRAHTLIRLRMASRLR